MSPSLSWVGVDPSLGLGLAIPFLGWRLALRVGVWSRGWPFLLGGSGLAAFGGYNYNHDYNHTMTTISEGGGKKKTGLALRVGVGPFGSGLALLSWTLGWPAFCGNNYNYR